VGPFAGGQTFGSAPPDFPSAASAPAGGAVAAAFASPSGSSFLPRRDTLPIDPPPPPWLNPSNCDPTFASLTKNLESGGQSPSHR